MGPEIMGVGIDAVELDEFAGAMAKNPGIAGAVFTEKEKDRAGSISGFGALAFAAKEACFKALGESWTGGRLDWREIELVPGAAGEYSLCLSGEAAELAAELHASVIEFSCSIDARRALAEVVLTRAAAHRAGREER